MRISGLTLAIALLIAATVQADTILDQIGPNSSYLASESNESQLLTGTNAPYSQAVIDKFTISGTKTLTEVDAAVVGSNGFVSYSNVTAWDVEIYSSVTAASTSLTGDVASFSVAPGSVTLTTPFGSNSYSALVQVPISSTLAAGTYYVAVIAASPYPANGELSVYNSIYAGNNTAIQVNPAGGWGYTDNQYALDSNAAYRILGNSVVPEPSSLVLTSTAAIAGLWVARRRNRRRISA